MHEAIREIAETFNGAGGLLQAVESEIQLAAIGNAGEGKTQRGRFVTFREKIAQGEEIAKRLGHFLAFDEKVLRVEPIADEVFPGGCFALGDFVFVMRES